MKSSNLKSLIQSEMFAGSSEMNQRFLSLRKSNLLPNDKGQAARDLSKEEIVNGILSVMDSRPGYASIITRCAKNLLPVGGKNNSYRGTSNFGNALVLLLSFPDDLIELKVKGLEFDDRGGMNYSPHGGRAQINYKINEIKHTAYLVPETALSLTEFETDDALSYDPKDHKASFEREYVLNKAVFKRINYTLEQEEAYRELTLNIH